MGRMTAKIANKYLNEMEYIGSGFGYTLSHKRQVKNVGTYSWNGYLWHCAQDDDGNILRVLCCCGKDE